MVRVEVTDGGATVATVDIECAVPQLFVVDVVARVAAAARRLGWSVTVPPGDVADLLDRCGLGELCGQPERLEQPAVEVEEVVQPGQPPA